MDDQQRSTIMAQMASMTPNTQLDYIKKLVEGGLDQLIPPSATEIKEWKVIYPSYLNSEFSVKKGRKLPLKYCVKNPCLDEILSALTAMGYKCIA